MIVTQHVCKRYGKTTVLDDVSVTFPKGSVTSIIGPNGAGKTTLLMVISRLYTKDSGVVTVDGMDIGTTPSDQLARHLAILRQDNALASRLTVRDLVTFGRYPHSRGRPTLADKEHVERAIAYLDMQDLTERYLDELSGGQRQRAFVAMVLCQDTDYVLLDEPLNNLDMPHAASMMKLMRRISHDFGKTIIMVLHDINFASWYSDSIVALRQGKLFCSGSTEEVIREDVLSDLYQMDITVQQMPQGKRLCLFYG
ncbi:MAG: ATP-binding cassette domain-containing protein [Burkholderiaceae bacterium]|jgi:iron complex transport system ATP-binding protein|nr:ATP-binding cassette domain-containing protein [Burkholderiaceae bacterium]